MDFLESRYLYLWVMLFSMAYPLAQSFERRIQYYTKWKALLPAMLVVLLIFVPWDAAFTSHGVWWFNSKYHLPIKLFGLPLEEWSFFIIVPFACIFIYEVLRYFVKTDYVFRYTHFLNAVFGLVFIAILLLNTDKVYTLTASLSALIAVLYAVWKKPKWLGWFYFMYAISWIPFIVVNGALTGLFTSEALVNYNPEEFMGVRVTTIPIEDSIYNFAMLFLTVAVYEARLRRSSALKK